MNNFDKKNILANQRAKTQFKEKMATIHPDIIHGEYIKSNTKINCKCKICGYKWMSAPDNLLRKDRPRGCPKCAKQIGLTDNEIRKLLLNKYNNMEIISEDISLRKNIIYKFFNNETLYINRPDTLLRDNFNNFQKYWTTKIYKKELLMVNPDIECISKFINNKEKILHHCKIHNLDFMIDPNHAIRGQGCLQCKGMKIGNKKRLPVEAYKNKLRKINPTIILLDKYKSSSIPTKHKCNVCGNEWYPYPSNLLKGEGCPRCISSIGESKIREYLESHKINYKEQYRIDKCRSKNPLPFDFAIFDSNNTLMLLIEYQGRQHYMPSQFGGISIEKAQENLTECQKRDHIKETYCKKNSIDLLLIKYTEKEYIANILDNKLKSLGIISNTEVA